MKALVVPAIQLPGNTRPLRTAGGLLEFECHHQGAMI